MGTSKMYFQNKDTEHILLQGPLHPLETSNTLAPMEPDSTAAGTSQGLRSAWAPCWQM